MSYISLENFGGKTRGLKFNQIALEVYAKHLNLSEAIVSSSIYATFYAGLYGCCIVKSEEIEFTLEQVSEWVDELYNTDRKEEIKKVCDAWEETHLYREWLKQFQDRLRAILEPEKSEVKTKKKVRKTLNGSRFTSSPLET